MWCEPSRMLGRHATAGDIAAARSGADELRQLAVDLGTPLLRARAAGAAGAVLLADGDAKAAIIEPRKAFNQLNALGIAYEAARIRLLITEACEAQGDHDAAVMESGTARSALDALQPQWSAAEGPVASAPDGLTPA